MVTLKTCLKKEFIRATNKNKEIFIQIDIKVQLIQPRMLHFKAAITLLHMQEEEAIQQHFFTHKIICRVEITDII